MTPEPTASRGSIHLVHAPDRPRSRPALVFVPEHDRRPDSAARYNHVITCHLATNETEMAAPGDLLAARETTGLAYDLLVHRDIFGYVRPSDLGPARTSLFAPSPLDAAVLTGDRDPRWAHKIGELCRLQDLSAPLAQVLGETPWCTEPPTPDTVTV